MILVAIVALGGGAARAKVEGGPMAANRPLRRSRAPAPGRHRLYNVGLRWLSALAVARPGSSPSSTRRASSPADLERALQHGVVTELCGGPARHPQAAGLRSLFSVVFGVLLGGRPALRPTAGSRVPATVRRVLPGGARRAADDLLLPSSTAVPGLGRRPRVFWCVVIGLTLYNGSVLRRGVPRRHHRGAAGPGEAAYAIGHAQDPGDDGSCCSRRPCKYHAARDHQPVRGGPQGHLARLLSSWLHRTPAAVGKVAGYIGAT